MTVEINHTHDECIDTYMIKEYNDNVLFRYIVLYTDEMKQLSKLLKELGF